MFTHPPHPTKLVKMPLRAKTIELAVKANAPKDQLDWLEKSGLSNYAEVAIMASSEIEVLPQMQAPMEAETVVSAKTAIGKIAMKRFLESLPRP